MKARVVTRLGSVVLRPFDVACPTCGAKRGEKCQARRWQGAASRSYPSYVHVERQYRSSRRQARALFLEAQRALSREGVGA